MVADTKKPEPLFGFTRFGKYSSPNPVIVGRQEFIKPKLGATGPYHFYTEGKAGNDKPHAIILSRRPEIYSKSVNAEFRDLSGLTRFGRARGPYAVIRSRPYEKPHFAPGPGAYEVEVCDDCKIAISMKGRWPEKYWQSGCDPVPGPNHYYLPGFIGKGPAYSLSAKYPDLGITDSSPGPIYQILPERPKAKSLTFKPFPMRTRDKDPGPGHYNAADAHKKMLPACHATKFGKAFCSKDECDWSVPFPKSDGPGPCSVNIDFSQRQGPNPAQAVLTSRPKLRNEGCGSGNFVDLFNMTRFGRVGKKSAVIVSRHEPKEKESKSHEPIPVSELPGEFMNFASKKIGIKMKSRPEYSKLIGQSPGPGEYNLTGSIGQGPSFSIGPKFRGNMGRPQKATAHRDVDISECYPQGKLSDTEAFPVVDESPKCPRKTIPFPESGDLFDLIPYLENMCTDY